MKAEIKSFCLEYSYPEDAINSLLSEFDRLKHSEYYPLFQAYIDVYNSDDPSYNHGQSLKAMKLIAEKTGIHEYTLDLLLHICMAKHCRELYDQAGIPVKVYHDSMLDLKWKLMECKTCFDVWGTFVGCWYDRFFDLSRFALGRLQFEDDISLETFEKDGKKLAYGDWVINMHVPSSGKLTPENCMQSLRMASEFFADRFPDGIAKFRCTSWLLSPLHQTCLSPESGIRQFASMFDLASVSPLADGRELWRIFHRNYTGSTEGFPSETTLQKAYLKLLADGDVPQSGLGYIFMKDGEII